MGVPDGSSADTFAAFGGDAIAAARKSRGWTQADLARRASISVSLLRKIEQGSRTLTLPVQSSLAMALGRPRPAPQGVHTTRAIALALPRLREAMDCYDIPAEIKPRALPQLRTAVDQATTWRLASRYSELAAAMPALLTELTTAAFTCPGPGREETFGLLTLAYRAVDAIADKHGYLDMSARAIELIRWAAARSGDPLLGQMAAYVRAELFFAGTRSQAGLLILDSAAGTMPSSRDTRALAMHGALQMRAAVLAARAGNPDEGMARLEQAHAAACHVPDGIYAGTAFGPSSIMVHQVAAATEAGDAGRALQVAAEWHPPRTLPAERRSHYYIEIARAHRWAGNGDQALAALWQARQEAPQHVRHNAAVKETTESLIRASRRPAEALVKFASWLASAPI